MQLQPLYFLSRQRGEPWIPVRCSEGIFRHVLHQRPSGKVAPDTPSESAPQFQRHEDGTILSHRLRVLLQRYGEGFTGLSPVEDRINGYLPKQLPVLVGERRIHVHSARLGNRRNQ